MGALLGWTWRIGGRSTVSRAFPSIGAGCLSPRPSGSGKSTVLDAVAAVLTPPTQLSLNAAASNGGQRDKGPIDLQLRGAARAGTAPTKRVRSCAPTFARKPRYGAASCFDTRMVSTSNSAPLRKRVVMRRSTCWASSSKRPNTVSTEGLKKFYAVVRGDHALSEFETYGLNEADMAQFNKDHKETGRAWRDHAAFEGYLCNILHISSPKTLTLLHKTQAAKNIGSLDDLFRKYMLDMPRTHDLATAAVAQFKELEEAHDGVVDQRRQIGVPGTSPGATKRHTSRRRRRKTGTGNFSTSLRRLPTIPRLPLLKRRLERQLHDADALIAAVKEAESEQAFAKQQARSSRGHAERAGRHSARSCSNAGFRPRAPVALYRGQPRFAREGSRNGKRIPLPSTREEFEALKRALAARARHRARMAGRPRR